MNLNYGSALIAEFKNSNYNLINKIAIGQVSRGDSMEVLERLKDDPNIYISYIKAIPSEPTRKSDSEWHPKVGINPRSHYNTPLGIYTYPLKEIWEKISDGHLGSVPYGGKNPYIAILRKNSDANFIEDMKTQYDESSKEEDMKKLNDFFVPNILTSEQFNEVVDIAFKRSKGGQKIEQSEQESESITEMWNFVRHLSYIMVERKKQIKENSNIDIGSLSRIIVDEIKMTRDLNYLMPDKKVGKLNKYGLMFNRILQGILGYDGFADKSGEGYIHSGEPTQAVFLNPRAYDILGIVDNEGHSSSPKEMEKNLRKSKLKEMIDKRGDNLSDDAWRNILKGYPDLWFECSSEIKWEPEFVNKFDDILNKRISNTDYVFLNSIGLPSRLDLFPKTKKAYIKELGKVFKSNVFTALSDVLRVSDGRMETIKNDPELNAIFYTGWKSLMDHDISNFGDCPYKELQDEYADYAKQYWANQIKKNPIWFESCPFIDFSEDLQGFNRIYEKMRQIGVEHVLNMLEKIKNNGFLPLLRETRIIGEYADEISRDPTVRRKLKELWGDILKENPEYWTELIDTKLASLLPDLKEEQKQGWLDLLNDSNIDQFYANIYPELKDDEKFMEKINALLGAKKQQDKMANCSHNLWASAFNDNIINIF